MGVLILHDGPIGAPPYPEWLPDYEGDIVLLASEHGEQPPAEGYAYAEAVTGYETGGQVEARVLDLARRFGIDRIVAFREQDVERAAQLRDILGLPGQRMDSVLPFRDRVVMKYILRAAGVPVAANRSVECATDIVAFTREHGFPVVVKPRDASGATGPETLETPSEVEEYLAGGPRSNLMVEELVPGSTCHVDGLAVDGRLGCVWSSYRSDRSGGGDVTLDPDDPLAGRLLEFTDQVLAALPSPDMFACHVEIVLTPDDSLVLSEIACGVGGAVTRPVTRAMSGVDPHKWWLRAALGLPLETAGDRPVRQPKPVNTNWQIR